MFDLKEMPLLTRRFAVAVFAATDFAFAAEFAVFSATAPLFEHGGALLLFLAVKHDPTASPVNHLQMLRVRQYPIFGHKRQLSPLLFEE